jgi:hypothetical protein
MVITVGAPTPRTFAAISTTSHRRQWSMASFKIGCEEGHFLFQLTKDWNGKVRSSSPHHRYLYRRESRSSRLKPMPRIVRGMPNTSTFSPSGLHDTPLTASGSQAHSSVVLVHPAWWSIQEHKHSRHDLEESAWPLIFGGAIPKSQ